MVNLLLYNIAAPEKLRKIQTLAIRLGFRTRVVRQEEFALPIGALVELPGAEALESGDGTAFSDEMLVLCNVSGQAFQAFLSGLRTQKTPVALKAMTTEHNLSWSSSKLHGELAAEHENMKKVQKTIHK
ncbi:MAG: DUF3783 domain-containing protein [Candidatus Faecousia sp.]|nr:DUF3783 domain-containing protein [Oscillospiraceae bacterium]MDY2557548.1 DUF3783 domain-containing protein [Candidatus Faecousia sp.]